MASVGDGAQSLQSLINVQEAILGELEPTRVMGRIAQEALGLVAGADGASVWLSTGDGHLVCTATCGSLAGTEGTMHRAEDGLAATAMRLGAVLRSNDTERDARVEHELSPRRGIRSVIVVPLRHELGVMGVLLLCSAATGSFTDHDVLTLQHLTGFITTSIACTTQMFRAAESTLSEPSLLPRDAGPTIGLEPSDIVAEDLPLLSKFTGFVANSLGLQIYEFQRRAEARERIRRVLASGGPDMVVQPIFDLSRQQVVGFEALARFRTTPTRPPQVWFQEASAVGLGLDLEVATVRRALKILEEIPDDTYLSLNLSPDGATSRELVDMLSDVPSERIQIEVTEHTVVQDYDQLNASLKNARDRGAKVAVDDAGAGYASMRHILRLKPDCIKLDIGLTSGIDTDPVRRALAASLISFAKELDATIVAEGIETQEEMDALRSLGVSFGQGYYLGRPAPPKRATRRIINLGEASAHQSSTKL